MAGAIDLGIKVATAAFKAAKTTPSAAKRVAQLTQALPTMTMSFGRQEISVISELAGSKGKSAVGFLEKLLGEAGTATVQTAKATKCAGKSVSIAISEAGETVAKLEAQPSFLEKLAQLFDELKAKKASDYVAKLKSAAPQADSLSTQIKQAKAHLRSLQLQAKDTSALAEYGDKIAKKTADKLCNPSTATAGIDWAKVKAVLEQEETKKVLRTLHSKKHKAFDIAWQRAYKSYCDAAKSSGSRILKKAQNFSVEELEKATHAMKQKELTEVFKSVPKSFFKG